MSVVKSETEKDQKKKVKKGNVILSFGMDEVCFQLQFKSFLLYFWQSLTGFRSLLFNYLKQNCLIVYRKNKKKPFKLQRLRRVVVLQN